MKYPKDGNWKDIVDYTLRARRVEPVARMHGGPFPEKHIHRFEIKGGVTLQSLMAENISNNNVLLKRLMQRGAVK